MRTQKSSRDDMVSTALKMISLQSLMLRLLIRSGSGNAVQCRTVERGVAHVHAFDPWEMLSCSTASLYVFHGMYADHSSSPETSIKLYIVTIACHQAVRCCSLSILAEAAKEESVPDKACGLLPDTVCPLLLQHVA